MSVLFTIPVYVSKDHCRLVVNAVRGGPASKVELLMRSESVRDTQLYSIVESLSIIDDDKEGIVLSGKAWSHTRKIDPNTVAWFYPCWVVVKMKIAKHFKDDEDMLLAPIEQETKLLTLARDVSIEGDSYDIVAVKLESEHDMVAVVSRYKITFYEAAGMYVYKSVPDPNRPIRGEFVPFDPSHPNGGGCYKFNHPWYGGPEWRKLRG